MTLTLIDCSAEPDDSDMADLAAIDPDPETDPLALLDHLLALAVRVCAPSVADPEGRRYSERLPLPARCMLQQDRSNAIALMSALVEHCCPGAMAVHLREHVSRPRPKARLPAARQTAEQFVNEHIAPPSREALKRFLGEDTHDRRKPGCNTTPILWW